MTQYEIAGREYLRGLPEEPWGKLVEDHLRNPCGIVISKPEVFVLARRVDSSFTDADLEKTHLFDEEGDMIHVDALAGDWVGALQDIPLGIEWISFQRRDEKVKRYPLERFCRKFTI